MDDGILLVLLLEGERGADSYFFNRAFVPSITRSWNNENDFAGNEMSIGG